MQRPGSLHRNTPTDLAARGLALACGLNLNGVFYLAFGAEQIVSFLMLATALYLSVRQATLAASAPLLLLTAAIIGYLVLGTLFFDPTKTDQKPWVFYQGYAGGLLIIWAIASYVVSSSSAKHTRHFLAFLRNTFLLSAASVWISPFLYTFFANLPPSAGQRMGGFFGNPNEAAIASLFAVALTLNVPFRQRFVQVALVVMAAGAVILTLSKSGMILLLVLLSWFSIRSARGISLILVPFGAALLIALVLNISSILQALIPVFPLEVQQQERILDVGRVLGGQFDAETTTNRTYLWSVFLDEASEQFPSGLGLGSGHRIVGGIFENGEWQGVHNTFIMIFGESGPLPALLLIASVALLAFSISRKQGVGLELPILLILMVELMATHTALITRYDNLMFGVLFGLARRGLSRSVGQVQFRGQRRATPSRTSNVALQARPKRSDK